MLRIQCTCGKFLKVDDALVGKKIKCPACTAVQLVTATPDLAESVAATAPKPKKAPATNAEPAPAVPKKRRSREEDEEEDVPRKKKRKKKEKPLPWLLIGGGAGAFLLLLVGGLGVWLLLRGGDEKAAGAGSAAKDDLVAIKFFVPHKKGDKREVTVTGEIKTNAEFQGTERLPAEMRATMPKVVAFHEDILLRGVVRTLEVNPKGEETTIEVTVNLFEVKEPGEKKFGKELTLGKGSVFIGTRVGSRLQWSGSVDGMPAMFYENYLNMLGANHLVDEAEAQVDQAFGPADKQRIGGTWPLKADAYKSDMRTKELFVLPGKNGKTEIDGTGVGKLVNVLSSGDKSYYDVEINATVSVKDGGNSATLTLVSNLRLPSDATTGPVKKKDKIDIQSESSSPIPAGPNQPDAVITAKMTVAALLATDIKYLGNSPITDSSRDKKGKDTARAPRPGEVLLNNAKVEWVPDKPSGSPAVKVSALYAIPPGTGFPKSSTYCLCVEYTGADGNMRISAGRPIFGNGLGMEGSLMELALIILDLPKGGLMRCNVALYENMGTKQQTVLASQQNVEISGPPPTMPSPTGDKVAVELSNVKVEMLTNKKLRFSADYKINDKKLVDVKKNYILIAKFEGQGSKAVVVGLPYGADDLLSNTSLTPAEIGSSPGTVGVAASLGTNFEVWLAEVAGMTADGTRLSNIAKGQIAAPGSDAGKLNFELSNITASLTQAPKIPQGGQQGGQQKGGGKKGGGGQPQQQPQQQQQPSVLHLQVTWKKTAGDLNPKAAYALCAIVQGVPSPLMAPQLGTAFQSTYQFKQDIPIPNPVPQSFNLAIVELLPGQASGQKVSQEYPVRLK